MVVFGEDQDTIIVEEKVPLLFLSVMRLTHAKTVVVELDCYKLCDDLFLLLFMD
jgi:hypothetical protein